MTGKERIKRFVLNLAALGIGCMVALVLLEVGLRIFNPIESRLRGDEIVLPANKKYIFESSNIRGTDQTIVHTKNSIGFRGPELPKRGLEDYLSIITVGGSTTECFYLSDGKDWPSALQELLKSNFNSVWLNNAGLDGHSTFGHTILLRDIIVKLKPKVVIFLIGANDRALEEPPEHTTSHIKGALRFNSIEGLVKSATPYSEVASAALNLYRFLRAKYRGLPHRSVDIRSLPHADSVNSNFSETIEPHINIFVPAFERRLSAMVRLAKSSQINPVLITQPMLYGNGTDPSTGINLGTVEVFPNTSGHAYWTILELYNQATRKLGKQENVLTIDLAQELEKNSDFFYDPTHFTNEGAAEASEIIYKRLLPYLMRNYRSFSNIKEKETNTATR